MLIAGVGISILGMEKDLNMSVVVLCVASAGGGFAISFIVAGLQAFSPDIHRGRIMSFYSIISQFIPALGGVVAGVLAQAYSPMVALQVMASIIIVGVIISFFAFSTIRRLESFEHV